MRGGARKGAGRKPGPKGPKGSLTLWLPDDMAEYLATFGTLRSDHVDGVLRKTAGFKKWKAERK